MGIEPQKDNNLICSSIHLVMFKKKIAAMSQFGGTVSPKPGFSLNNVFSRSVLLEGIIGGKTFGTKLLDNKNLTLHG